MFQVMSKVFRRFKPRFKLLMLTHQKVIDWVKEGFDHVVRSLERMVKCSFKVCGISSSYHRKVRCVSFYQAYMEGAQRNLETNVEESKGDAYPRSIKALNKKYVSIIYIVVSFYL